MLPPRPARLAALLVGAVGLLVCLFLWRPAAPDPASSSPVAENAAAQPTAAREAAPPPEAGLVPPDRDLARLLRAIARGAARPQEALLSFRDDASLHRFLARASAAGFNVLGQIPALRAVRVGFADAGALARERAAFASEHAAFDPNSLFAVPRPPAREDRPAIEPVPFGNNALSFLGATGDRSAWGRGTLVAVLDTGVAPDPTFGQGRLRTLDLGLGTAPGRGEDDGHGTAVAALVAGGSPEAPGVAPAATLLSIRVTDATGTSDLFTIAQALVAAVDSGARIINVSLGGYATGGALDSALDYATRAGAVVVAAAGNDQAAQLAWPAADSRVLSVGAVDRAEQQVSFSNSGPQLQLSAPGFAVQTAWLDGDRVLVSGTSASAPLVAGAVAAVVSQHPGTTPAQAAALLLATASDAGAPGADPDFGRGILNLGSALHRDQPTYVDTAVSSHHFDPVRSELQVVVQNRGGGTASGLTLAVEATGTTSTQAIPALAPGAIHVVTLAVSSASLREAGSLTFTTTLANAPGAIDAAPANNRRTSTLSAPTASPRP